MKHSDYKQMQREARRSLSIAIVFGVLMLIGGMAVVTLISYLFTL